LGVQERRKRIVFYYELGYPPTLIIRKVSEEFDCSERTLWRDWSKRREWMPAMVSKNQSKIEAYLRMGLELFTLREDMRKLIENTSNPYAKIKAS
jgi:hypothetical protein